MNSSASSDAEDTDDMNVLPGKHWQGGKKKGLKYQKMLYAETIMEGKILTTEQ